ncbi:MULTISPECIES: hypothetical protein [unclassified Aminobacter]|uniref:hypothetical protein n=1 Tax=unclassified Aminobacter TaxID=2644704 RepID=UPI000464BFBB|nr:MULTISPECIES: hypothetical protein [unclassified Aminobacter]TWG60637.1 hypothetical protein L610_002700000090 [Aminobacter sp. J44]TWH25464.1 hypothetical protein L611_006400000060 [Aminobacter sp. J15]
MIQTALFFILGFLTAMFIAVLVAPAIWRRAVVLTRRRIEASMPLKLNEIRAEKDMVRAEAAVQIRKLEMTIKSLNEKNIEAALEAERRDEEIRELNRERAERTEKIAELVERGSELEQALASRVQEIEALAARLAEHETQIKAQEEEIRKLGDMYDEASFAASSRQIELVGQEAKIEQMLQDLAAAKSARNAAEQKAREAASETKAQRVALTEEQKKSASLQKQVDRLTKQLAELEDKLGRRERELERLKERLKDDAKPERVLQAELGDERDRRAGLEVRVAALTEENRQMRAELGKLKRAGVDSSAHARANEQLRQQITELAAEVVALTARIEGPESPINRILAKDKAGKAQEGRVSLAERIRMLQQQPAPAPSKRKAS